MKKQVQYHKTDSLFNKKALLYLSFILLLTGFLYRNSLQSEFLSYDDTENVVNNLSIQELSAKNISGFFSSVNLYMYTPLTFLSYAVDYNIDGLNPFYFKLTNLLLHLLNVLLIYILSFKLLKKNSLSLLLTLLFAIHPINTDSISWISTRSNLLATLFFLSSLIFYVSYINKSKYIYLFFSFIFFALSLLSKPSGIMLPITLFLFDYLLQRKFRWKTIVEKIPFLLVSIAIGLLTIYFRTDSGNPQIPVEYSFLDRAFLIIYSFAAYIIKAIIPYHLSEIYAYPLKSGSFLPALYYLSLLIISLFIVLIFKFKSQQRILIFGFSFFSINSIITLIPLLEDGFLANRYAYLPYFGIFFIIIKLFDYLWEHYKKLRLPTSIIGVVILFSFSYFSYQRSLHWKNTLTLFDNVIVQEPDAAFAFNSRGIAKFNMNDLEGSLYDYNQAIRLYPKYSSAYYNRGIVHNTRQDFKTAHNDYSKAIELNPNFASSFLARGIIEMDVLKNNALALKDYNEAIRINPAFPQAYYNRGILKMRMNLTDEACIDFWSVKKLGYPNADNIIENYCK